MKIASIEKILSVYPHSNADAIEFVKVLGYDCIVKKEQFKEGDLVVFIQPDNVLPDTEWAKIYKAKSNRIKAVRLRGLWSYGVVESLDILPKGNSVTKYVEGAEVSDILGIYHYEPPVPQNLNAKKAYLPHQIPKTDEERCFSVDLTQYEGQLVDITLKIDGSSASFYYKDGETGITSRSLELKPEFDNNWTLQNKKYNILDKLTEYCQKNNVNLALRGEIYGQGIQGFANNPHSKLPLDIAFFSVWLIDENRYAGKGHTHYYINVCKELNLPTVPLLEENVPFDYSIVKKYGDELNQIDGKSFEGVVVKAENSSFKIINKEYDSKK